MPDSNEMKVEARAINSAVVFFKKNGWSVKDVSHVQGDHGGYDLFLEKDLKQLKVEVKGSAKPYHGIPDLYGTSVDADKRLRADFLCVVYFPPGQAAKLALIPGIDLLPNYLTPKISYRICNEFKKLDQIGKYLVDTDESWPN